MKQLVCCLLLIVANLSAIDASPRVRGLVDELVEQHGESERARIEKGVGQLVDFWRAEDGDDEAFETFTLNNFAARGEKLDAMFNRFETLFEKLDGHMNEIVLAFRKQSDLDLGTIYPFDESFAGYDPGAHLTSDLFANKLAFVVLLNFPLTTLEQRLESGDSWPRRQWAEARLAQRFGRRVPAEVNLEIAKATAIADQYIAEYNIWMHHLLDADGKRLFPEGMRLLSHWNLRDEIKSQYGNGSDGLPQQRMLQKLMESIVEQSIPELVVNNPHVDWNPSTGEVTRAAVNDSDSEPAAEMVISSDREPDTRYEVLLGTFKAARLQDEYSPTAPTLIDRRFNEDREIPEARVRAMFDEVLTSPLLPKVAKLIEQRLGRPLEPFDIWYNGFRGGSGLSQAELDAITKKRYPDAAAYEKDMVNLLVGLDFPRERAEYLAGNIAVEAARGSGHAWGAQMREAKARLRTRVAADGMDYKGFNIAVHEMGHNVEQTLSLNDIDHTLLNGVPNTAFTEALAFVFQARDLDLLGVAKPDPRTEALTALNNFWGTCEIAAVGLVDMEVWHWMYAHPDATPAELREATVQISHDIWNRYFAPVFGTKDVVLLGIYSHMIHSFLYLPDYPIGHMIAAQIEQAMEKAGKIGPDFERVCRIGRVTPDMWMRQATGAPVGPAAILEETAHALEALKKLTP